MGKIVLFIVGLIVGLAGGASGIIYLESQQKTLNDDIVLGNKMYYEGGEDFVALHGTLTGQGLAYPNDSVAVTCWADRKECGVSSLEQIGQNQIGRLDG